MTRRITVQELRKLASELALAYGDDVPALHNAARLKRTPLVRAVAKALGIKGSAAAVEREVTRDAAWLEIHALLDDLVGEVTCEDRVAALALVREIARRLRKAEPALAA